MKPLVVVGAGGHGKVVADTAREMAIWDEIVFVDSLYPELDYCGQWKVVACEMDSLDNVYAKADFVVAVGNNTVRIRLFEEASSLGFNPVRVIHPFTYVSPGANIGLGVVVFAGAVINIGCNIGEVCIVNTGATIDHDCDIDIGVHISPGVNLAGGVTVGARSWIGIGASVKQLTSIGYDVLVGAGAAVVSNITNGKTVVGVPAKEINN